MLHVCNADFSFNPEQHDRQYNHLYFNRYAELLPAIKSRYEKHDCSGQYKFLKIVSVNGFGQKAFLIGTLILDFPKRSNALLELSGHDEDPNWKREYKIFFEDDSSRIQLSKENVIRIVPEIVSGITLGIWGVLDHENLFNVEGYILAGAPVSRPRSNFRHDRPCAILLSDLPASQIKLKLLASILCESTFIDKRIHEPNLTAEVPDFICVDAFIVFLSRHYNVIISPSTVDPTSHCWPNIPICPKLLPKSSSKCNVHFVTNPYTIIFEDFKILGIDGQNYKNWTKNSVKSGSPLQQIKFSIESRIIAPTAPDSLPCFPSQNQDTFILRECPHYIFVGNNSSFEYEELDSNDARIFCLQSYDRTNYFIMLDFSSGTYLQCHVENKDIIMS